MSELHSAGHCEICEAQQESKVIGAYPVSGHRSAIIEVQLAELKQRERELLAQRAQEEAAWGVYRCSVCQSAYVNPEDGYDTCSDCAGRI